MKSFTALAFGIAALSGVFASELNVNAELAARDSTNLERRWGHHWNNNFGAKCHANSMCKSNIWMSRPSCSASGHCGFKCINGYQKQGWKCVKPHHSHPQCSSWKHCDIHVQNGKSYCYNGKCTFKCNWGFHRDGDSCVPNEPTCNDNTCYPVQDGYSTCEDGKCSYNCATYLGYTLFTNAAGTAYRCVNLEQDPQNCGDLGNVCPTGYNGKGKPYCSVGTCELDCAGFASKETDNGMPYCTDSY